jgi:hypothetical protein
MVIFGSFIAIPVIIFFGSIALVGIDLSYPRQHSINTRVLGFIMIFISGLIFFVGVTLFWAASPLIWLLTVPLFGIFFISGYYLISKSRRALYMDLFCIGFIAVGIGTLLAWGLPGIWGTSCALIVLLGALIVVTTLALLLKERRLQY